MNLTEHTTGTEVLLELYGSSDVSPLILNLDTKWTREVSFRPWQFLLAGKRTPDPFNRRLGGPQLLKILERRKILSPA